MGTVFMSLPAVGTCKDQWADVSVTVLCLITLSGISVLRSAQSKSILPSVSILKVLGEGGFSFVYLAQDELSDVSAWLVFVFM